MKILHLCSYYIGNKLYKNLFSEIIEQGMEQSVYIPIKEKKLNNKNVIESKKIDFYYDFILKKSDRFLYKKKIYKQADRIGKNVKKIKSHHIIHAHTLFSDGGTAYLLSQKHNIKYIVSIRNTDINIFYKYAVIHRPFIFKVLKNASAILFISHAYKDKTLEILPSKISREISSKSLIIPNGINEKWFQKNVNSTKKYYEPPLNLIFVGSLDKNKNLNSVLYLIKKLEANKKEVFLNVAGEGHLKNKLISECEKLGISKKVKFHGNIDIEELITLMNKSDIFILPSYRETFGISYIEAISRGVPVIYTRNEGIDNFYPEGTIGYSTDPDNIDEMMDNINKIIFDYENISKKCIEEAQKFAWNKIAKEYLDLYEKNIEN